MEPRKTINIFEYTDYKMYLKDYYQLQKRHDKRFSYRYFGIKSRVSSSMLMDVISGRRRLTLSVMDRYAEAMKLQDQERNYFSYMVKFVNSRNVNDKNYYFTEMIRLRGKLVIKYMGREQYEFFSSWYNSVIRELVTLPDFKEDYTWIAKHIHPKLTPAQIKKSIAFLCEIGLLMRNNEGKLIQTDSVISSEYEIASIALKNFHLQMLDIAKQSVETIPAEYREISSLTLGVSHSCFTIIKERIRRFKEELLLMILKDTSESDTVCQLNFQLYPFVAPGLTVKSQDQKVKNAGHPRKVSGNG